MKYVILIITISAIIKTLLTDFNNVYLDSDFYYRMTVEYVKTGIFPTPISYFHNIGMIIINSFFFRLFDGVVPFLTLHKILSITYSTLSLPFAYLILKKFFSEKWALFGLGMLAFDWRLVQNTTLGITEPLFLLFVWSALYFSLKKSPAIAFMLVGMATIVRFEGVVLIPIVAMFVFDKKKIIQLLKTSLFFIPVGLVKLIPFSTIEKAHVFESVIIHESRNIPPIVNNITLFFEKLGNSILYYGWSTFPTFTSFIPLGLYHIIKQKNYKLLTALVISSIPGIWAYLDAFDTRYFFMAFIFFTIISVYGLQMITPKIKIPMRLKQ